MKTIITFCLFLITNLVAAQYVSGTISDQDGSMLGVSIEVKNSTSFVFSDFDGNFKIKARKNDTLIFKLKGYYSQTEIIQDYSKIDMSLVAIHPYTNLNYRGVTTMAHDTIIVPLEYKKLRETIKHRSDLSKIYDDNKSQKRKIIFDGIEISQEEYEAIDPILIESVMILKEDPSGVIHSPRIPQIIIESKNNDFLKLWESIKSFRKAIDIKLRK